MSHKQQNSFVAVIPARSGSKGVKDKNIRRFCDKNLLQIAIEFAFSCGFRDIIVSSDSDAYLETAKSFDTENLMRLHSRNKHASSDSATDFDVLKSLIDDDFVARTDKICWLRPTNPLRSTLELHKAIENKMPHLSFVPQMVTQ